MITELGCTWTVTTKPVIEPISLDEAKDQARIPAGDTDSDAMFTDFIQTAREAAESYMGRGLLTQTVTAWFSEFATVMPLPLASPLQSVTSVKYYASGTGTLETLATTVYDTDTFVRPGAVVLKPSQSWPSVQYERLNGRVEVVYVVGWTAASLVPELIRHGIRLYVSYLDLDRSGMDVRALDAKAAAERCWADRIHWTPPQHY